MLCPFTLGLTMLETLNWLTSMDRDFAFLLALPFVVGFVGLANLAFETKDKTKEDR